MRDLFLLPDCARAVRLFLDKADNGPDEGLGLRLARAVDRACVELNRDPSTSGPKVVLEHLLAQGPIDADALLTASRVSAAWAQHWAVRGVAAGSWAKVEEGLSFTSADGLMTVRAQLRVSHQGGQKGEHAVLYRVGRVPTSEREITAATAQLAVVREAAPGVLARQCYLVDLSDWAAPADVAVAAYARLVADASAREAKCDRSAPVPPISETSACKRCRMQGACGRLA